MFFFFPPHFISFHLRSFYLKEMFQEGAKMEEAQLSFCRQVQSKVIQHLDEFSKRDPERRSNTEQIRSLMRAEQEAKKEVVKAKDSLDKMNRNLENAVENAKQSELSTPNNVNTLLRERANQSVSKSKEHKENAQVCLKSSK